MYRTISNLDAMPDTARLLGNLTVAWSHAERVMYFLFWVASQVDQVRAYEIYETFTNNHSRSDLTKRLLNFNKEAHSDYPELMRCFDDLLACQRDRNEFVHRTWVRHETTGKLGLLDHRMKKGTPKISEFSDDDLRGLIMRIVKNCDRILDLLPAIYPDAMKVRDGSQQDFSSSL